MDLLTNSLWHLPSKSIQRVNFPHLNGVHIFFCQSWYNIFFLRLSKYNFFFLRKSEYNFFFLKKPGPPPGYEMGGPLYVIVIDINCGLSAFSLGLIPSLRFVDVWGEVLGFVE